MWIAIIVAWLIGLAAMVVTGAGMNDDGAV
jgi:hypothetical protein